MKTFLPLLLILLLSTSMVFAQETPEVSKWKTEQRCIAAPSQPPDGWTYDGVIFTFKPGDGIHARRADVATPYYVAFDSDSEFGIVGSFSADGGWFAVPTGHKDYGTMSGDSWYVVNEIRVYSTAPVHTLYHVSINSEAMSLTAFYGVNPVRWLDQQHVVTEGQTDANEGRYLTYIFNPFEKVTTVMKLPVYASFVSASPDNSRWIYYQRTASVNEPAHVLLAINQKFESVVALPIQPMFNTPVTPFPQWTSDSSKFAAVLSDGTGIGVFGWDGNQIDAIPSDSYARLSFAWDGSQLAYMTRGESIRIADLATRTIIDTCIETPYSVAFSPDGKSLAFGLEPAGYTYILDLQAWQAYRIDLAAADVVGWYPLG